MTQDTGSGGRTGPIKKQVSRQGAHPRRAHKARDGRRVLRVRRAVGRVSGLLRPQALVAPRDEHSFIQAQALCHTGQRGARMREQPLSLKKIIKLIPKASREGWKASRKSEGTARYLRWATLRVKMQGASCPHVNSWKASGCESTECSFAIGASLHLGSHRSHLRTLRSDSRLAPLNCPLTHPALFGSASLEMPNTVTPQLRRKWNSNRPCCTCPKPYTKSTCHPRDVHGSVDHPVARRT
jgi:hypothetical protein